jgi:hypothetical protein
MGATSSPAKSAQAVHSPPKRSYAAQARDSDIREKLGDLFGDVLLTEPEAARAAGFSPHALKSWRMKGENKGPTPTHVHGNVRYRVSDLKRWLAER